MSEKFEMKCGSPKTNVFRLAKAYYDSIGAVQEFHVDVEDETPDVQTIACACDFSGTMELTGTALMSVPFIAEQVRAFKAASAWEDAKRQKAAMLADQERRAKEWERKHPRLSGEQKRRKR